MNKFNLRFDIDNQSGRDVLVKMKGGISYKVTRPKSPSYERVVYLKVVMENVDLRTMVLDPSKALTKLDAEILRQLALSAKRTDKDLKVGDFNLINQTLAANVVLTSELVERREAIHSEILGTTLYCGQYESDPQPLNTPMEINASIAELSEGPNLSATIRLVDPNNKYGTLYTNMLGRTETIEREVGATAPPGLYINLTGNVNSPISIYYTLEELTKEILRSCGIYYSEKEAKYAGGNEDGLINMEKRLIALQKDNQENQGYANKQIEKIALLESKIFRLSIAQDNTKYLTGIKDSLHKSELLFAKQKSANNEFGDAVKNISALLGLGGLVYKMLS